MNSLKRVFYFNQKCSNGVLILRFSNVSHKHVVPEDNPATKLLKVAIVGMPNAGKSTLINSLIDRKVCAASTKVHTTKKKSLAILTEEDTQIVFLDTPGIVTPHEQKKYNLSKSFARGGNNSMSEANIIGVVHDASNTWTRDRIDIKILNLLEYHKKKPSFLVLNKVDLLKQKKKLLELTRKLSENRLEGRLSLEHIEVDEDEVSVVRGWPHFNEIFMISSLTGDGMEQLKNYLIHRAKPAPWIFPPEKFSNEKYEDIIINVVRAKFLDALPQELPYIIEPQIELFEIDETGKITAIVNVKCPTQRKAKVIAGDSDGRLRQVMVECQEELQNIFRNYVRLRINMDVRK